MSRVLLLALSMLLLTAQAKGVSTAAQVLLPPNTSASPGFAALPLNGSLSGKTNVSTGNVHTLLYPGNTTKVLVHYLPWWNGSPRSGINTGYSNADPKYAIALFGDLARRGVDGVMIDWYGQTHPVNAAWLANLPALAEHPNMTFSIMIDIGSYTFSKCSGCNLQQTILYNLAYLQQTYFNNPQYLKVGGEPVVSEFALTAQNPPVDWAAIQAAFPNVKWIHLDNAQAISGFDITDSAGSFLWADPGNPAAVKADMSEPNYFYGHATTTKESGKLAFGAAFKGFNNYYASWNDGSVAKIPQACGATWLETFATLNKYYSASRQIPFVQLVTWDDYEEGSELETGIDNCNTVSAQYVASTKGITVKLSNPTSIDHLEIYTMISPGVYEMSNSYPATVTTIPTNGSAGTFYIKAVGKPFMTNTLSGAVTIK
jgi:hypothetical protein